MDQPAKTIAEQAAAKAEAERQERAAETEAISNIRNGRVIIFILAAFTVFLAVYFFGQTRQPKVLYVYVPFAIVYTALGIFYYRNPFMISMVALSIYLAVQLTSALVDPTSLLSWFIFKFVIVFALIRSMKFAYKYKPAEKTRNTDLLDDGLID